MFLTKKYLRHDRRAYLETGTPHQQGDKQQDRPIHRVWSNKLESRSRDLNLRPLTNRVRLMSKT
ncbi:MAG: hypothetical protein KME18_00020 [Phormidium tanganyikae FI6-MK23]|nr:hypothetical protein [Phormidium tanganyikae FI6-MK23]